MSASSSHVLAAGDDYVAKTRSSQSDQPVPTGGVTVALRHAAESYGLDAVAELYNEALRLTSQGHVNQARDRLQMLLCLDPDDGEARLLLAKILVACQDWRGALAALDHAGSLGIEVPTELRQAIEGHLAAEGHGEFVPSADPAVRAREEGELRALRAEALRLRTEQAELLRRLDARERETHRWAWTTAGVSGLALLFVLTNLVFGGSSAEATPVGPEPVAALPIPAPATSTARPVAPAAAPSAAPGAAAPVARSNSAVAERAASALQDAPTLGGTRLEVTVDGAAATLSGSVANHLQRKEAERALLGVGGVDKVDSSGVIVRSRVDGTTHTVKSGDHLSKLAYAYYGDSSLTRVILNANKGVLKGKSDLSIGQVLTIPPVK